MREKIQKLIQQLRATDDPEEQDLIKKEIDLVEEREFNPNSNYGKFK